ncbi:hypothetical protein EVAR_96167_1 [Eumeta japonica]|uniref:Uncharacterized protein n=1 Tax=Eumeta variegata TaxID=151549 RepID=A0A4C1VLD1_EUMVA|nr:hypothetical protein EVAR_96167_1 [Eumeta japonica]
MGRIAEVPQDSDKSNPATPCMDNKDIVKEFNTVKSAILLVSQDRAPQAPAPPAPCHVIAICRLHPRPLKISEETLPYSAHVISRDILSSSSAGRRLRLCDQFFHYSNAQAIL